MECLILKAKKKKRKEISLHNWQYMMRQVEVLQQPDLWVNLFENRKFDYAFSGIVTYY